MISDLIAFLENYAVWLAVFSVISLVVASVLATWFVAQLPVGYFLPEHRHLDRGEHWAIRIFLLIVKNVIGVVLILAGFTMLFTPGQGLLTLLAGVLLTNFPGKYRLERMLARQPKVMAVLNWLRARRGQAPFKRPD
ncbi:MAG: PGPGW domain-containing protein [Gammaproteobacteria bacterium]